MVENNQTFLKAVSTADLVRELREREGVSVKIAGPYETLKVSVRGPAMVFIITD
ncbi:MAG: BC1881 family protein [Eubacteriales bacterium]|nr:BC1881 family protein [Eubacteriales bacterium]